MSTLVKCPEIKVRLLIYQWAQSLNVTTVTTLLRFAFDRKESSLYSREI